LKKIRNMLYISLPIIIILNLSILGLVGTLEGMISSFLTFFLLLPLLMFIQFFPKIVSLKEEVPFETVYETIFKKKPKYNLKPFLIMTPIGLVLLYYIGGVYEILTALFTYWSFAVCGWLILLFSYSYQLYINKPEKV